MLSGTNDFGVASEQEHADSQGALGVVHGHGGI
jgi:hypothetical protein